MFKETKRFSIEEKAAIAQDLKKINEYTSGNDIVRILFEISQQFGKLPFQDIEIILREIHSQIYLVSFPRDYMPVGTYQITHPDMPERYFQYFVVICLKGSEAAQKHFNKLGITYQQNFDRLKDTGTAVIDHGAAQMASIPFSLN
jgi:hypothetical protein